jgi:tricorn protease
MNPQSFALNTRFRAVTSITILMVLAVVFSSGFSAAAVERPLMRFPDIHGNTIVFVYGDDIWSVPAKGGIATRLTIHDGSERFPKFSPDGSMIAFTGEYDGNADVYVMNVHGGEINRVTYHSSYDQVVGWHPTENKIIFRSSRKSFSRFYRLFMISPDGTHPETLIMHEAVQGSFSPDGKKIAYNRVPREFRTWKRYRGGTAQQIYLFDFEKMEDTRLTDFEGTDRIPMWIGNRIYFSSDRDGILNIYYYDTVSGEVNQVTSHKDYDVRRPSMGGKWIVYELGGSLWVLDTESAQTEQVDVRIETDTPETRPTLIEVKNRITDIDCSPEGNRALITARGEVFTVPAEHGQTRNLTEDSGSRERGAVWSPDGKRIAYVSDNSGEYEIYVMDLAGEKKTTMLTSNESGYRHTPLWSPDSRKIAFADQTLACYYVDLDKKKVHFIDRAKFENVDVALNKKPIHDYCWSPDSKYLAYSKMTADQIYQVYIYSLEDDQTHCVSNGIFNDFGPVFSSDGKHLFFVSNRRFDPTYCDFEWEMVYKNVAAICCLTLEKDGDPLLEFRSDEAEIEKENGDEKEEKKGDKEKEENGEVKIDFEGISDRIEMLPLDRGNYRQLGANESNLYYLNKEDGDFNRFEFRSVGKRNLCRYNFKEREEKTVIEDIDSYRISRDGKHIVYKKDEGVGIIGSDKVESKGETLDLSDLKMWLDPIAEWEQMYYEAWRMERDFYYEPNMHGVDWEGMKKKYEKLLPYVSCRSDIRYLIGELLGELNTSHTYVFGGDYRRTADWVNVGMLGVDWTTDKGRYRIGKIYKVADWTRDIVPPLTKPGINVKEGDYIIRVNGEEVTTERNIYSYFQDLAGEQVKLTVSSDRDGDDSRDITVKPLHGEHTLRYLDWVEHNRKVAAEESGGKIGYLHLPDTYLGSAVEFPKYFYSQTRKKGLIIDGRFNGGGLNPDIFLRRLRRDPLTYWTRRYSHDQTSPSVATNAHMACITNRQAGSGGDELPMEFQMYGMGPVIGTRTWGGLVGVSMWISLIDGGGISAPDYRIYDRQGNWLVENVGVKPDIVVDLDPVEVSRGYDAQLMKTIEYLKKQIKAKPREWPEHQPFPVDKFMK